MCLHQQVMDVKILLNETHPWRLPWRELLQHLGLIVGRFEYRLADAYRMPR